MDARDALQPVSVPHPPLTDYYPDEGERASFVRGMFDSTAASYDRMERLLGLGTGVWYRGQALLRAGLEPGMHVIDVGTGTGMVARKAAEIVGASGRVVGVDPSAGMLAKANVPDTVELVPGSAEALPFPDASFDFLSMGYALRHIGDLSVAFREFHRVLKPGGRLCLLEITRPQSPLGRRVLKLYMRGVIPLCALLIGAGAETRTLWQYYWDTIEACVPPDRVLALLEDAGFSGVRRHVDVRALSMLAEFQASRPVSPIAGAPVPQPARSAAGFGEA